MSRIVIEGVSSRASLVNAISVVLETMNAEGALDVPEHVFTPASAGDGLDDRPTGERDDWRRDDSERNQRGTREAPPKNYVPCPQRGTHSRLTDCWMCWSDVMRGAALEPEVLRWDVWALPPAD